MNDFFSWVEATGMRHVELAAHLLDGLNSSAVRGKLRQYGLEVASINNGVAQRLGLCNSESAIRAAQEHTYQSIRIARQLGCDQVVLYIGHDYQLDTDAAVRTYAEKLGPCLREAQAHKVVLLIENHFDSRDEDPKQEAIDRQPHVLRRLIEEVGSEFLQLNFDPANFHIAGVEAHPLAYDILRPWIRYLHLKDCRRYEPFVHGAPQENILLKDSANGAFICVPLGQGALNIDGLIASLKRDGYGGFIRLEMKASPQRVTSMTEESLVYLVNRLSVTAISQPGPAHRITP